MREDFETLTLERIDDHLLVVTLDRPKAANSMSTQMGRELNELWRALYIDVEDVRCIVLTGAGDRVFSAGADLKERNNMADEDFAKQHALFEQVMLAMLDVPVPIIAAVNGAAYGGGCEFTLACDFAYASTNARFALTEITLGIMPGAMGTQNLPRAAGVRRAKEIILTGKPFSAEEALEWGVVNKVCAPDKLMEEALETGRTICNNAPIAVRQAKKSISMATQLELKTGYAFEIEAYNRMITTEDRIEGIRAYNEKRKPEFKGR